jgi:hypothetical protein
VSERPENDSMFQNERGYCEPVMPHRLYEWLKSRIMQGLVTDLVNRETFLEWAKHAHLCIPPEHLDRLGMYNYQVYLTIQAAEELDNIDMISRVYRGEWSDDEYPEWDQLCTGYLVYHVGDYKLDRPSNNQTEGNRP